ncbi:MAG: cytochrome c [Fuerstiella sp.]|nr:cytochrome c [Fuerstiella sp.]MCP4857432.1 cytochrome c [Fuerstiella sp.]
MSCSDQIRSSFIHDRFGPAVAEFTCQPKNLFAVACAAASMSLIGCGGSDAPAPQSATTTDSTTATAAPSSSDSVLNRPRRQDERWKDANGVEYLGKVPLDVFFDQPYSVASDATPLNGIASTDSPSVPLAPAVNNDSPSVAPSADPPTTVESGGQSWGELMPMSVIDEEIKSVRNFLNQSLQSVGSYNRSMLMVPPNAATVAVLSGIVMQHPEDISWKEDAIYIRDLARKMNESTLMPGKKDQDRLLKLFESLADTLNRSRPADLDEPPADDDFATVAEMRYVMMRMGQAETKLKTEVNESGLTEKKDMVKHEAAILGTMSKVVALDEYGYGDDEEYVEYAQRIVRAAQAAVDAAEGGDFGTYELALSKVSRACQECHAAYKND